MPYRYFIKLAFDGTQYHGWQIQENAPSVQQKLTDALCILLKFECKITGCGRTDTGVHALEYFAHFDSETEIQDIDKLTYRLNALLTEDIIIHFIRKVDDNLHARFSATQRTYQYFINKRRNPFNRAFEFVNHCKFNVELMNDACEILKEYSDFSCFSKAHTQVNNFNCSIYYAHWTKSDEKLVFTITANRFLRNMVRAIVGTMLDIGSGKIDLAEFRNIIENRNRSDAGASVPAKGLFLTSVIYPEGSF